MDKKWKNIIWGVITLWVVIVVSMMIAVTSGHAQMNIQQKGNNTTTPGLSNIGVLPCIATAAAPSYTEGFQVGCSTDLAGALRMSGGGGGGGGTSSSFGAAFPATGTAAGWSDGINMQGARVFDGDSGGGTEYVPGAIIRCVAAGGSTECFPPTVSSADALADQTATFIHGYGFMYNGATWDRIRGTIAGGLLVNVSNATLAVTQSTSPWVTNISQFGGNNVVTGTGASGVGIPRVTVANDSNILATQSGVWSVTAAVSNAFLLDATFTARFPTGSTPADNESNAVSISRIGNFNYIFDGATWDRWTGAVTQSGTWNIGTVTTVTAVTSISNTVTVQGAKTNNNAAPGATNVGVLPCVATAAAPSHTEGNQVGCSTTLGGGERVVSETAANFNVRPDTSGATGAAPPARADFIGGLSSGATGGLVQGFAVCDTFVNINISTATTTLLVTGVSGRHVRICSINMVTTLANTVALISGTGATCGTGTTGMNGGTTAGTGWPFSATGGIAQGSGLGAINQTNATGDSVCIVTGSATQISGRISYTIY